MHYQNEVKIEHRENSCSRYPLDLFTKKKEKILQHALTIVLFREKPYIQRLMLPKTPALINNNLHQQTIFLSLFLPGIYR